MIFKCLKNLETYLAYTAMCYIMNKVKIIWLGCSQNPFQINFPLSCLQRGRFDLCSGIVLNVPEVQIMAQLFLT